MRDTKHCIDIKEAIGPDIMVASAFRRGSAVSRLRLKSSTMYISVRQPAAQALYP